MPSVDSSGTFAPASGAETTIRTFPSGFSGCLVVNVTNLAGGDTLVIRIKRKVLSGGTERTLMYSSLTGVQTDKVVLSWPFTAPYGATITMQQTAGSYRTYEWQTEIIGAVSVINYGTTLLTVGEATLVTYASNGNYVFVADLNAMALNDDVTFRVYRKVLSTGSEALMYSDTLYDAQTNDPIMQAVPWPGPYGGTVKALQPAGTLRTIDWSLESISGI